jgi:hypothetical protein
MPSTRYAEIAPKVKDVCKRYGLPYNSGPFGQQWWMVHRTIARLAFPGGRARPKPGPYHGSDTEIAAPATGNGAPPPHADGSPEGAEGEPEHAQPAATENVVAQGPNDGAPDE